MVDDRVREADAPFPTTTPVRALFAIARAFERVHPPRFRRRVMESLPPEAARALRALLLALGRAMTVAAEPRHGIAVQVMSSPMTAPKQLGCPQPELPQVRDI